MERIFFVALDEYFSKKKVSVNTMWILTPTAKNWPKKSIKTKLEQMAVFFCVVFGVRVPIFWEKGLQNMISTHPKQFDHITHG